MDQLTKTYVAAGFAILAVFELWTGMRSFGTKGGERTHVRMLIRLHRVAGYVFLSYAIGLAWIGYDMLRRYSAPGGYTFGPRPFTHACLAVLLIFLLLLKISFIRLYRRYRPYVPLLGIVVGIATLVAWAISGWMFLAIVGGSKTVT